MSSENPRSSARGFRVHSYEAEGATVVECFGKLTFENAPSLKEEVRPLIPDRKRIVLDLKAVPQIDSAGGNRGGLVCNGTHAGLSHRDHERHATGEQNLQHDESFVAL